MSCTGAKQRTSVRSVPLSDQSPASRSTELSYLGTQLIQHFLIRNRRVVHLVVPFRGPDAETRPPVNGDQTALVWIVALWSIDCDRISTKHNAVVHRNVLKLAKNGESSAGRVLCDSFESLDPESASFPFEPCDDARELTELDVPRPT